LSTETETPGAFERGAALFMAFVCAICLLAVSGWLFNHPILASLRPEYIPMAPSTALLFLGLCSTWLIQRVYPTRRGIKILVQASLLGMLLIVFVLALRYFTGLGPDLEKLLYPAPPMFGRFSSARISPLSALGFFLAIPALLLLTAGKPGSRTKSASAVLSLALLIFSSLICLGYLYGAPPLYGGTLIPVAVTSAISFLFLSLGLLITAGTAVWPTRRYVGPSLKARLMRTFIPASLFIVLLQGLFSELNQTWIINPAVRVALAALAACWIVILLISFIANNLSSDIDRAQKAEDALARSEAKLHALFAGMTDVVIVYDIDGRYIEVAPTNPANLYRPADEMLRTNLHAILPKEPADIVLSMVRLSIQNGQVVNGEYALEIDSKKITFSASVSRLSETTAILVAHDITRRKQMEQDLSDSEAKYRALVDEVNEGFYITDPRGSFTFSNHALAGILGIADAQAVIGRKFQDFVLPEKASELGQRYQTAIKTGIDSDLISTELIRQDGSRAFVEITHNVIIEGGQVVGIRGAVIDITERKQFELVQNAIYRIAQASFTSEGMEALYRSIHSILGELIPVENFFIALYDPVNDLISFPYFVDKRDSQPAAPTKLQGPTGYVIRTGHSLLANRETFDRLVQQGEMQAVGTVGVDWMGAPLIVKERVIGVMTVKSYTQEVRFDQGDLNLLEFVSTQVAQAIERKSMEEQIRTLSLNDELTGLYNRRGFTLLADHEVSLAYRLKRNMLLFFGDVDGLKTINDSLGHAQGDLALQEVAAILKKSFREADIVARFGGDEYVVLAVDAALDSADALTKRIQAALEAHNQTAGRLYSLSLSLGIVRYDPASPCTISELIAQADGRMYAMKQARKAKQ
jgi:diguanylate cyclase (GGDEF)-like protein/PAS domain S-box-containing protein